MELRINQIQPVMFKGKSAFGYGSEKLPTRPYLVKEIIFRYKSVIGDGSEKLPTRPYLVRNYPVNSRHIL